MLNTNPNIVSNTNKAIRVELSVWVQAGVPYWRQCRTLCEPACRRRRWEGWFLLVLPLNLSRVSCRSWRVRGRRRKQRGESGSIVQRRGLPGAGMSWEAKYSAFEFIWIVCKGKEMKINEDYHCSWWSRLSSRRKFITDRFIFFLNQYSGALNTCNLLAL